MFRTVRLSTIRSLFTDHSAVIYVIQVCRQLSSRAWCFFWPCIMNWLYINYQLWCTDYYLFIKYYSPLNVSSLKCSYGCTHAAYDTVTLYESSWWPVGTHLEWELTLTQAVYRQATRNSHREWQYRMLHVYKCILLKMSTWGSKHVEENSILWINNNQCIKVGN